MIYTYHLVVRRIIFLLWWEEGGGREDVIFHNSFDSNILANDVLFSAFEDLSLKRVQRIQIFFEMGR